MERTLAQEQSETSRCPREAQQQRRASSSLPHGCEPIVLRWDVDPWPRSIRIRVLFVNENIGGHATVHRTLERELAVHHPDVKATFVHLPAPRLGRRLFGASVPGFGALDLDLQPLRAQLAQSLLARRLIARRRGTFDVLHLYTHNVGLLSCDLVAAQPTVVSLDTTNKLNAFRLAHRDPTRWTRRLLPLTLWFEGRVYRSATLVATHSDWAAASVAGYGVASDRIRVVRFGVELGERPPADRPLADPPEITFVGRQMQRKGGELLLNLFNAQLRDVCRLNLVTTDPVVGGPGIRVYDDITPGDPRLGDILRRSTAFVFPSPIDQAPNVVLEAMAAGVAVVGLSVAAVTEMVEDGVTGTLLAPDDRRGIVTAIKELVGDPARALAMGAAGRERAERLFDGRVSTARLVDVLYEAAQRFSPPE